MIKKFYGTASLETDLENDSLGAMNPTLKDELFSVKEVANDHEEYDIYEVTFKKLKRVKLAISKKLVTITNKKGN